jgi:hypothetical protein
MLKKTQAGAEVEFTITVKEFATPKDGALVFFAQADKQTNVIEAKLANGRYEPAKTTWVKIVGPETTKRSFYLLPRVYLVVSLSEALAGPYTPRGSVTRASAVLPR